MVDIDHLSYSSITTYQMCPRSWKFHYLDKVETPTAPALVFGSAFHQTIEDHIRTGLVMPGNDRALSERWQETWARALIEDGQEKEIDWQGTTEKAMRSLGVTMFSDPDTIALVDALQPLVIEEQVQIERYVTLRVPGVPVPIVGYIDLIEADGVPADFKTAGRSWNQSKADDELQPIFYLAALNQTGRAVGSGLFRHYVFVKTKKPKVQIWESHRTPGQMFWLFGLIKETWQAIEAGAFPPNTTTFKCSPRYCEYWSICRGGS